MKEIKKYTDVVRYGKGGTEDVLKEGDIISITEKIDGANASFRLDDENPVGVSCYSRNKLLDPHNTLSGFYDWVLNNIVPIKDKLNPDYIYYGEWLCKHKVIYKKEYYNNFYSFSIWSISQERYLEDEIVIAEANRLCFKTTNYFYRGAFISFNHLMNFVGKSDITEIPNTGEGIVVKNIDYIGRDGKQKFVKLVSEKFAEIQPQRLPKNPHRNDALIALIMTVLTQPRVEKILFKAVDEGELKADYTIEDMGTILKTIGSKVYDDIMKEEADLFEQYEPDNVRRVIGKNVPKIVKNILKEQGRM